jgi:hypothetical protein
MKIFNYSNFLLESGKGLSDLKIFYSDDFREILLSMVSTISDKGVYSIVRKLLEAEDNSDKLDSYTLIDKTDKNDMISYVQSNRIIRDKGVDNDTIKGFIQVYRPTGDKHWKQGRVAAYSIGRWVRHIFVDVFKETITPMDLESFVNSYKSIYDKISKGDDSFELVYGEDIRYWYLEDNYLEVRGQLGNSCMRYERCQKYLDIYVDNPEVCKLLILKDEKENKILGRALVWTIDGDNSKKFMDRIYTINDSDKIRFQKWAKDNNVLTSLSNVDIVKVKPKKHDFYPYMDTLCFYNTKEGILTKSLLSDDYIQLKETDGNYTGSGNGVWSDYHAEYIDEDDARWCDDIDDYAHYECVIWLDYLDIYVSENADTVYSEYSDQSYYREDTVWSDILNDYLHKNDAIKIIVGDGKTDWCGESNKEIYIEIDDKIYSRDYCIIDPYSNEPYFLTDESKENILNRLATDEGLDLDLINDNTEEGIKQISELKSRLKSDVLNTKLTDELIKDLDRIKRSYSYFLRNLDKNGLYPFVFAVILNDKKLEKNTNTVYIRSFNEEVVNLAKELLELLIKNDILPLDIKEDVDNFYNRLSVWDIKKLIESIDTLDISKLPTEIYKKVLLLKMLKK